MQKIILFDGDCSFCNQSVQFIINRDPLAKFKFASQKSDIGQQLLKKYHVPEDENSLILLEGNHFYSKSTAALKISKHLTLFWRLFYLFIFVPKPLRDTAYQIIANNRYKWREKESCILPSTETRKRFL